MSSRRKSLEVIHPHAAGVDIGAEEIFVAVPASKEGPSVRSFGTYTADLTAIRRFLTEHGITTVAMITYAGGLLETPSLDKFRFRMAFHVKADNSKNSGKAVFGSDAVEPVLNFRIQSRTSAPIETPIPSFAIAGGAVEDLEFPIGIPLSLIDKNIARKIAAGDPIPYFLSGKLEFELLEGTSLEQKGQAELDLASGEISTRPSGDAGSLLSGLL